MCAAFVAIAAMGAGLVALPAASATVPSSQHNTAVLVGIDHAPGSEPLLGSVADTKTMRDYLINVAHFKSEQIKVLTEKAATRSAILGAVDSLARRTSGRGLAVFFIATHSGISGGEQSLATAGGGRIKGSELAAKLKNVKGRLWTTVSSCFSGAYALPGIVGTNRIATFSAKKDKLSWQGADGTVLVVYMVKYALLGRGAASIESAFKKARLNILNIDTRWEPVLKDGISGDVVPGRLYS